MEEIVKRLHEHRRVEEAKSILESEGYSVGLSEAISSDDLYEELADFIYDKITEGLEGMAMTAASEVPGYESEFADEDGNSERSYAITKQIKVLAELVAEDLMINAPDMIGESIDNNQKNSMSIFNRSKKMRESNYIRRVFPTEQEAWDYAREEGLEVSKTQNCADKCIAWFRKLDYNPEQKREELPEEEK